MNMAAIHFQIIPDLGLEVDTTSYFSNFDFIEFSFIEKVANQLQKGIELRFKGLYWHNFENVDTELSSDVYGVGTCNPWATCSHGWIVMESQKMINFLTLLCDL